MFWDVIRGDIVSMMILCGVTCVVASSCIMYHFIRYSLQTCVVVSNMLSIVAMWSFRGFVLIWCPPIWVEIYTYEYSSAYMLVMSVVVTICNAGIIYTICPDEI